MTQLLGHLPSDTGMAYVVVQHLDPKHESMLKDILARSTRMPVREVQTGMPVEKDEVYVIPPNFAMELVDGNFKLVPRSPGIQMPVDHFLKSLADRCKTRAVGVILSGTNSDGSLGMQAIKAEGGIGFAQDEGSAKFPEMPRAAVAAGAVDYVLPPAEIARELSRIGQQLSMFRPVLKARVPAHPEDGNRLRQVFSILRAAAGVDFSLYRETTIRRRIGRRMILNRVEDLDGYVKLLRGNPTEIKALYEDLLITVTAFFRDPATFRVLGKRVFPKILKGKGPGSAIRVWVSGCATGEEAYSIAIELFEACSSASIYPTIQIFATDVSESSLERARAGIYMENALVDVSPDRIRRFFKKVERGYQISKPIRDACIFAKQNVAADPPFSNLDMLSCRNLLIYLEPALQKRVIPLFHYALNPGGYLVLGSSESISGFTDLFTPVDKEHRIFAKKAGVRPALQFPAVRNVAEPETESSGAQSIAVARELDFGKTADKIILSRFAPAGVLVDANLDIVQFRGRTGLYLESPQGAPSVNVLKMVRTGLLVELRAAIQKARKTGSHVRAEGVRMENGQPGRLVDIDVVPISGEDAGSHLLILFGPLSRASAAVEKKLLERPSRKSEQQVPRLERELAATKEYLQAIIEEQEASNEELKSANEEILSSNEELQSTNEELETAKEELQSTNEELSTVNEELQNRNVELADVNDDLNNLLSSVNIPILMLGPNAEIRRFTPPAQNVMNLIPTDVGRPVGDIKPNLTGGGVVEAAREVIETVTTREREVQDNDGHWYLMRVRPYRTSDNRIDGAVVAFLDIDPVKRSLEQASRERYFAEMLVETVRESLILLDNKLRITTVNHAFYTMFQKTPLLAEGKLLYELPDWEWSNEKLRGLLEQVAEQDARIDDLEIESESAALGRRTLLISARQLRLPGAVHRAVLLAVEDITKRKAAESALRESEQRFRQIFEAGREGIWILDAEDGKILEVNQFFLDLIGYQKKELLGRRPWELGVYEDPDAARRRFEHLKKVGHDINADVVMKTREGRKIYLEAVRNVYREGSRKVAQFNYRDTSQRRELEEQLREVQKLESIGQLAGGLAHDFNNILNVISVYTAIVARDAEGDRFAEPLGVIEKAIERGAGVVHQLLTFARKTDADFRPVDINGIVREVAHLVRQTFPPNVAVRLDMRPDLPSVSADANQLHQALLNLAVNARDAMPDGGELTIKTSTVKRDEIRQRFPAADADVYLVVELKDTGVGMSEGTRSRIFEPFFTTKGTGGSGLGLPVAYGIVHNHRGFLEVESEAGEGTTVCFFVPAEGKTRKS
jgi:two-component system CheB/CheR fusion protein